MCHRPRRVSAGPTSGANAPGPAWKALALDDLLLNRLHDTAHELAADLVPRGCDSQGEFRGARAGEREPHFDLDRHLDLDSLSHGPDLPAALVGTI